MKKILLSKGRAVALIDDEDYSLINKHTWALTSTGYATTTVKQKKIYMHRLLLNPGKLQVDHVNQDRVDNRRANLRIVTNAQNTRRNGLRSTNRSGFKGVSFAKSRQKWVAQIQVNGRGHFGGYFDSPEKAARAYNDLALSYFGEFAYLNPL